MKNRFLLALILFSWCSQNSTAQETTSPIPEKYTAHNKGKFFVSWGGNRDNYTNSTIHFKGKDYDFTLENVEAQDKPKGWHIDYINPARMTIPQTNFRMGYFINDHYSIAVGVDHMKYVMNQNQTVKYSGNYPYPGFYGENPANNQLQLSEAFLIYEHCDGLNYVNTEFSRHDDISSVFQINNTDKIQISLTEGVGAGLLYPDTKAILLGRERYHEFHVSGYGASVKAGIHITLLKHFYIEGELKGGYINMPDIKTTVSADDSASQHFLFLQRIISFGWFFKV